MQILKVKQVLGLDAVGKRWLLEPRGVEPQQKQRLEKWHPLREEKEVQLWVKVLLDRLLLVLLWLGAGQHQLELGTKEKGRGKGGSG